MRQELLTRWGRELDPDRVLQEYPGRRFTAIDEVNLYRIRDGKIADTWTLEDNLERLTQLGLLAAR